MTGAVASAWPLIGSDALTRAGLELLLVGALAGPVGWLVLGERITFAAESAAHAMLPGLALAAALSLPLAPGALLGAAVFAVLLPIVSNEPRAGTGPAIAALATGALAMGSIAVFLPGSPGHLERLLFGEPLAADNSDLLMAAAATVATWFLLVRYGAALVAAASDPVWASSAGFAVGRLRALTTGLVVVAAAVAASTVGNLLAVAVLVAPPLVVRPFAHGARSSLVSAGVAGATLTVTGLAIAYLLDTATGATVALTLVSGALLATAWQRLRGHARARA